MRRRQSQLRPSRQLGGEKVPYLAGAPSGTAGRENGFVDDQELDLTHKPSFSRSLSLSLSLSLLLLPSLVNQPTSGGMKGRSCVKAALAS